MPLDISSLLDKQQHFFQTGRTLELSFRKERLSAVRHWILTHESRIMKALRADLNKSSHEAFVTEIGIVLEEIRTASRHLKKWSRPRKVPTPLTHMGSKSWIQPEPFGISLIIGPWNYPFQLIVAPLIGAIAAGNCVVLKPSEMAPHTSTLIRKMAEEIFDPAHVTVVEGGVKESEALLEQPFDSIFFTGSPAVGRIVMEAAAKRITPLTLELGGKSPVIVDRDAHLALAAKRIIWGKFINAGQTCIAPDYLVVHQDVREELVERMKAAIQELYGEEPLENPDYPRIIHERHFTRLSRFLEKGIILTGGGIDASAPAMEPTLLENVSWTDPVMEEEIFGPILPVLPFDDLDEVIRQIRRKPKPLALYCFTESKQTEDRILSALPFGGGCVNDTLMHFASPYLPFGGVGPSGMGRYHGKGSFDCFSHQKSILKQTTRFDFPFRYPTSKIGLKVLRKLMR
ncbi:aldehyde dehydrogenase [Salinithrix halophila]|uniref:Aldehyde dehydrogenase n=1 Tax=Salinithrix halophila TaxID=1485204 RepID=A0ABV8JEY8_9BACL